MVQGTLVRPLLSASTFGGLKHTGLVVSVRVLNGKEVLHEDVEMPWAEALDAYVAAQVFTSLHPTPEYILRPCSPPPPPSTPTHLPQSPSPSRHLPAPPAANRPPPWLVRSSSPPVACPRLPARASQGQPDTLCQVWEAHEDSADGADPLWASLGRGCRGSLVGGPPWLLGPPLGMILVGLAGWRQVVNTSDRVGDLVFEIIASNDVPGLGQVFLQPCKSLNPEPYP